METAAPLSFAQQGIWCVEQLQPGNQACRTHTRFRLNGPLDIVALERAINEIVQRHDALRTTFRLKNGRAAQRVTSKLTIRLPVDRADGSTQEQQQIELNRLVKDHVARPFDLTAGPLIRAQLICLAEQEHVLFVTIHHIVCDGWSMQVFARELAAFYESFCSGAAPTIAKLPLQYVDYARQQRDASADDALRPLHSYWRRCLDGRLPVLNLPTDRPRRPAPNYRGATLPVEIPSDLVVAMKHVGRQQRLTQFMTLLAALKILLARYSGQTDVLVGCPTAGRTSSESEQLIGLFVNLLPLRTDLGGQLTVSDLFQRIRHTTLQAFDHQELPLEKLIEDIQPERNVGQNPLFQVCLNMLRIPEPLTVSTGLRIAAEPFTMAGALFDLTLHAQPDGHRLTLLFNYDTDLFDAKTIQRMAGHYQTVLRGIVGEPDRRISEIPILTETEKKCLLFAWNATTVPYPRDACIHQLFQAQVLRTPEAIALEYKDSRFTYQDLNERSNQLSHYLKTQGVGRESLVGICLQRSPEMIVGLLAILKAGGAYVPLDPSLPPKRLKYMLDNAECDVVLTQEGLATQLSESSATLVCFDSDKAHIGANPKTNPSVNVGSNDLAYINYTSGSTGRPKGVEVCHRGVVRLLFGADYAKLDSCLRTLQHSTISFDAATFEIWGPLLHGGCCALFSETLPTPDALGTAIREHGITTLWLTSSLFNLVIDEKPECLKDLDQLLIGGESLSPQHVFRALRHLPSTKIINGYGPTENTTFTCCHRVLAESCNGEHRIPIGRPIANTQVYVLDADRQPVPIGVPGELYIAGDGLARGYLRDPELTGSKFVPDLLDPALRMYKSNDCVRWRPDGQLDFLGRNDQQVKIRGFRVELGEIEATLRRHPAVREAVVALQHDRSTDPRLIAFVQPLPPHVVSAQELRTFLEESLPTQMVPSMIEPLEDFPRTASGKIDREALSAKKTESAERTNGDAAPRSPFERKMAQIWAAELGLEDVNINDNFFALGGHSLLAVGVALKIERELGIRFPPTILLEHPTIAGISEVYGEQTGSPSETRCIRLSNGRSGPPLFFVPGSVGGVWVFRSLVQHLGDRAVYGLQLPEKKDGRGESFSTLESMAAYFLKSVRQIQPAGPFSLAGYSFGGKVALEMAQQLLRTGCEVEHLVMIDAGPGVGHAQPLRQQPLKQWMRRANLFVRNVPRWMKYEFDLASTGALRSRARRFRRDAHRLVTRSAARGESERAEIEGSDGIDTLAMNRRDLATCHIQAWKNYTAQPYTGTIHLFRAAATPLFHSLEPDLGWNAVVDGRVNVHIIPGNHITILKEPYVPELARELSRVLGLSQE